MWKAVIGIALCGLAVTSAAQQSFRDAVTTSRVDVRLTGSGCELAKHSSVVLNGDDQNSFELEPAGRCHWTGTSPKVFRLKPSPPTFSLRLGGVRTECRTAREDSDPAFPNEPVAKLVFNYRPTAARSFAIVPKGDGGGPIWVAYSREVPRDEENPEGSLQCRELGAFDGTIATRTVADVDLPREQLSLRFGGSKAQASGPSPELIVNPLIPKKQNRRRPLALQRNDVVQAIRLQGTPGMRPTSSSEIPYATDEYLKRIHFESVTLTEQ